MAIEKSRRINEFILMLAIRSAYLYTTFIYLNGVYYVGTGSYTIDFNIYKEIAAILAFMLLNYTYIRRNTQNNLNEFLTNSIFIFYIIPMSCTYSLNNMDDLYFYGSTIYCLLIILAIGRKPFFRFKIRRNLSSYNRIIYNETFELPQVRAFCLCCCLSLIIYKFFYSGFSFGISFIATDIYSNREVFSSMLSNIKGSAISYVITIIMNTSSYVVPIYMLISIKKRRWISVIISIFSILCSYSLDSSKSSLFIVFIVLFVAWCSHKNNINLYPKALNLGALVGLIYSIFFFFISGRRSKVYWTLYRRLMYSPVWLNTLYYKFFSTNPKIFWSQNTFLLQRFIPDVYNKSPITIISEHFFNGVIQTPNTGMFADAYMNWGLWGIIIYPLLFRIIFGILNKTYKEYGIEIELIVATKLMISLTNIQLLRTNFVISFIFVTIIFKLLPRLTIGHTRVEL